jgi:hypothetical protein
MKRIFLTILLLFTTYSAQAGNIDIILSGGAAFSRLSNNQKVTVDELIANRYSVSNSLPPDSIPITNQYDTHQSWQTGPLAGIGIGHTLEQIFNQPLSLSLNLIAYYVDLGQVKGLEYPFYAGNPDTLNYRFNAESYALMFTPRLILTAYSWQPFIFAGIGVAQNRLFDFSETATNPAANIGTIPTRFGNQNVYAFAYQMGIGIQHQIYHDTKRKIQYIASVDYRYMNFGKGQLNTAPTQTTDHHLKVTDLSAQAAVLSLNMRFG